MKGHNMHVCSGAFEEEGKKIIPVLIRRAYVLCCMWSWPLWEVVRDAVQRGGTTCLYPGNTMMISDGNRTTRKFHGNVWSNRSRRLPYYPVFQVTASGKQLACR